MFKTFANLSIQKRLPLLICFLLLTVIVAFSYTSYLEVKNATLSAGKERLTSLTGQISSMFQQMSTFLLSDTKLSADKPSIKKYLQSGGKDSVAEAQMALDKEKIDTLIPLIELYNASKIKVLGSGNKPGIDINRDSILPATAADPGFAEVGRLYLTGKDMYFPITVTVSDGKQVLGYLIKWRKLVTSPQELESFSKLIGAKSAFYIGNDDGRFWTNGLVSISPPPVDLKNVQQVISYNTKPGEPVLGLAQKLSNTRWLILIALSEETVTETASHFLYRVVIIGGIILIAGILLAWLISRNIIEPLKKLTVAAGDITQGNYHLLTGVNRKDELGKLAKAFNIMVKQVKNTQANLEKKVRQRTEELEFSNKEMEAFSYSVSHDLRAPLRIINGYADILVQDYEDKLDDEGKRITSVITKQAQRMGQLIDDLLNLSRLSKTGYAAETTDMNLLVDSVIAELPAAQKNHVEMKIARLGAIICDRNLIKQVWINLISNAIKFSAQKENPVVEITSYKNEDETIYVVKDNGVGFDMTYAHKLFGVFQRLHKVTEFEGTGIGLALVQRIVYRHGGKVWAESEPGKGAAFYFSLPVEQFNKELN